MALFGYQHFSSVVFTALRALTIPLKSSPLETRTGLKWLRAFTDGLHHGKAEDDFCAVLGLAGRELIIPSAALPGLCCVLVAGKVLISNTPVFWLLLPSTPQHQAASPASSPHQEAGGGQGFGRGHSQDS